MVGDIVQFNVSLTGPNPGDTLDFLGVDLSFPSAHFGTPSAIDAGLVPTGIIPDAGGFFSGASPGIATAFYDDLVVPSSAILDNGLFFSFTVSALAQGSGSVIFAPDPSSSGFDAAGAPLPDVLAGSGLDFTIQSVPEPGSGFLLGIGTIVLGGLWLGYRAKKWPCAKSESVPPIAA